MPCNYRHDGEYYLVKGWFESAGGIHGGSFYGAYCLPSDPFTPIRVVIEGRDATQASTRARSQQGVFRVAELTESTDTDGDYWYEVDGEWVCRPGKKGDGGLLAKPGKPHKFQGLEITVENPAGSKRSGVAKDGHKWEVSMKHDYGFLCKVDGADGEGVDVYIGPEDGAEFAYVVHQNDPKTKQFDEDKVMLGFKTAEEARQAYLDHYDDPEFFGSITSIPISTFKEAVNSKGDAFKWKSGPQVGVKLNEMVSSGAIADRPNILGDTHFVEPDVLFSRDEKPKAKRRRKPKMPHGNSTGPRIPTISQSGGRLGGNQQI